VNWDKESRNMLGSMISRLYSKKNKMEDEDEDKLLKWKLKFWNIEQEGNDKKNGDENED